MTWRLDDLLERLLAAAEHLARQAVAGEAALRQAAVLPVVGLAAVAARLLARFPLFEGGARQRRHVPVRRVDDLRRPQREPRLRRVGAPEGVVLGTRDPVAGPAVVGGVRACVATHVLLHELLGHGVVVIVADDAAQAQPLPLGGLLLGHELAHPELVRALERRVGAGVPESLEIRIAPRRSRSRVARLAGAELLPRHGRQRQRRGRNGRRQESAPQNRRRKSLFRAQTPNATARSRKHSLCHRAPPSSSTSPP